MAAKSQAGAFGKVTGFTRTVPWRSRVGLGNEGGAEGPVGPVLRKVPKSVEPPIRVWLRDSLPLAIIAWVVLAGTLGGFLGMMIVGASGGREPKKDRLDEGG